MDAVRPHRRIDAQDRKGDLDVVMIDSPRNEVLERGQGHGGKNRRDRAGSAASDPQSYRGGACRGRDEPQHWPNGTDEMFGKGSVGESIEQKEETAKSQFDQPRPMGVIPPSAEASLGSCRSRQPRPAR